MTDTIEMTADDPGAPSFGGGATRVVSEQELDGLIEATVSVSDVNHPRAPKETKRIEALARIAPSTPGTAVAESATEAAEAALLDAAHTGSSIVVDPAPAEDSQPVAQAPSRWRRVAWLVVIIVVALAIGVVASYFVHR
jgi:hypothetical protein